MRLDRTTYFSPEMNLKYMGHTQYLDFRKCQASAMDKIARDSKSSSAMLQGNAFDAYFEQGESGLWEFFRSHGLIKKDGFPTADAVTVQRAIVKATQSPLFMDLCRGKQQVIKTGDIGGVKFKIMMDSYHPGKYIVDRKLLKDFEPIWSADEGEKISFARAWGYDVEAAIYQAVEGNKLPFILACVSKEAEPDIALIQIPQSLIDERLAEIEYYAPIFAEIKKGNLPPCECGHCEFCRSRRTADKIRDLAEFEPSLYTSI